MTDAGSLSDIWTVSGLVAGTVTSLIASAYAVFRVVFNFGKQVAVMEFKIDTLWEFQMRRAKAEANQNGLATMNSPIKFTEEAARIIEPLVPSLRELYQKMKPIDDLSLVLLIERQLGDDILEKVCIPNNLYLGACLLIAAEAAKGSLGEKIIDSTYRKPGEACGDGQSEQSTVEQGDRAEAGVVRQS